VSFEEAQLRARHDAVSSGRFIDLTDEAEEAAGAEDAALQEGASGPAEKKKKGFSLQPRRGGESRTAGCTFAPPPDANCAMVRVRFQLWGSVAKLRLTLTPRCSFFSTHGQQSAAKGSSTTVSRSDIRLIQNLDSSAHGLVRRWLLIGYSPILYYPHGRGIAFVKSNGLLGTIAISPSN
jgi:hypothetical protein